MQNRVESELRFGKSGNAQPAQLYGWSGPEDGFTWTLGTESALSLPRPEAPFGFFLEITVDPLLRAGEIASQRMGIFIDSQQAASLELDHGGTFAFFVPPTSSASTSLRLLFRHPDARAVSKGGRQLALAFRRLRILIALERLEPGFARAEAIRPLGNQDLFPSVEQRLGVSASDLVSGFETLAGNCEFGAVQRLCGVEPLALLRFAGSSETSSIRGLDSDFSGIGEDLELYVAKKGDAEWMVRDLEYKLNYHTMMSSHFVSREEVLRKERRRVAFLRRKFIEDLAAAPRTFIYSNQFFTVYEQALALFLALRRRSKAALLWVQVAPPSSGKEGSVEECIPGLLRGYIDRYAPPEDGTKISLNCWLAMLGNAHLLLSQYKNVSCHP